MRDLCLRKRLSVLNHSVIFGVVLRKVLEANSFFCQYLKSGNLQLIINKNWGHSLQIFPRYLIASNKPLNSKVKCIRIHYWLNKIAARLFIKSQTNNQNNSAYSPWEEFFSELPSAQFLRPSLFNIFLCDLFYIMTLTLQSMQMITHHVLSEKICKMLYSNCKMRQK